MKEADPCDAGDRSGGWIDKTRPFPIHHPFSTRMILAVVILAGLYASSLYNYLLFHTLAELFSIIVAGAIFTTTWNVRRLLDNDYLLFLGIAYLFVGVLDLFHTMGYTGMPIFPGRGTDLPAQIWIAARYMESISLLISPLFIARKCNTRLVLSVYFGAAIFVLASTLYWRAFPTCFVEGVGLTPFKKQSEYVISAILLSALAHLLRRRNAFDPGILRMLSASIALTICSELAFTFYVHAFGFSNLVGHYFKILSFYFIYRAIIETGLARPYNLMFRQLNQGGIALESANNELTREISERKKAEKQLMKHHNELESHVKKRTIQLQEANEALKQIERDLNLALEAARAGKSRFDIGNNYLQWDERSCEIFGVGKNEFGQTYESWSERVHPEDIHGIQKKVDRQLASGKIIDFRYRIIRPDKEIRTIWAVANIKRDDKGNPISLVGLHFDETEKALAREELRIAKEAAEAANRAKSTFLAGMSHELRTPLNAILGFAQILEKSKDLPPSRREGVTAIIRSGKNLLTLLNDVLDISKIEEGKIELRPASIFLDVFIDNIAAMVGPLAKSGGVDLRIEKGEGLPTGIEADEIRLRQVLLNLLGNGVKFTRKGSVSLRIDAVGAPVQGRSSIRFAVEDTGVGIAPDQIETIFLPFEKSAKTRLKEVGSGLGLAISRRLVDLMGGNLQAKSVPGEGSLFRFDLSLPVISADAPAAVEMPTNITGYTGRRRKILVVDENGEERIALKNKLTPLGFDVIQAKNGDEAMALTREVSPDLIFMDMVMPGGNGIDAAGRLRRLSGFEETPIIIVSAGALAGGGDKRLKKNCNGFLAKPLNVVDLLGIMEEQLSLDWVYKDSPDVQTDSGPYTAPPADALAELKALARYGNMGRIAEWADARAAKNPAHAAFAAHLKELAKGYREQEIERLIRSLSQ